MDDLEEIQKEGGNIFEYHGAELFPERWFKLVVVLNTGKSYYSVYGFVSKTYPLDNTILYKRLENRNYTASKIQENVQAEIFKIIAEEARTSYKEDVVVYLRSDTVEDMEENTNNVVNWINTRIG